MKRFVLSLLSAVCLSASAQYCTITPADGTWNTGYDQTEYYWSPDQGQSFTATVYENSWTGSRWSYYPAGVISFGSAPYLFHDNSGGLHGLSSDLCFILMRVPRYSPAFALGFWNATRQGQLPQGWGSVDSWGGYWSSDYFGVTGYSWEVWLCRYSRFSGQSSIQFVDGGYYNPPSDVSAYESAYGQH